MRKSVLTMVLLMGALVIFSTVVAFSQEAIQVQPSSDGKIEASLLRAKVRGDVLSIRVALKKSTSNTIEPEIHYKDCYYTDIKDKKKYFPLKDSKGNFLAGPQYSQWQGGTFKSKISAGKASMIWVKFPAPPAATETVDLFVPGMLPFEEVKISRGQVKE